MTIRFLGSTSGYVELDAPSTAGNNLLVLPTSNGSSRQTLMTDGSGALSWAWAGGSLFYRLNSALAGANGTSAQSIFGIAPLLASNTVYDFEMAVTLEKTAGATSHTIGLSFGGLATLNNIFYQVLGTTATVANPSITVPTVFTTVSTASNTVLTAALASATSNLRTYIRGSVSINAGGNFIPLYTLSAAPGGAYSTVAGSFMRLTPIGASGSNSSQGAWS